MQTKRQRRPFTPQEDIQLYQLVQIYGTDKWTLIASHMGDRTSRQCRERYRSFLAPTITNRPWTREEDNLLIELHTKFGSKWSLITKYFQGRSDCNVKNRWSQFVRSNTNVNPTQLNHQNNSALINNSQLSNILQDNKETRSFGEEEQNPQTPEDEFHLTFEDTVDGFIPFI